MCASGNGGAMAPQGGRMESMRRNWGWVMVAGIAMIVLGVAALSVPLLAGLTLEMLFGWLLVIGGIVQLIHAFGRRDWGGTFLSLLSAVLYAVVGILLLARPVVGLLTLTFLLAAFFLVEGIFKIIMAVQLRRMSRWGWLLASGILSLLIAILIWAQWPSSAAWVIGLLVGIQMLFAGWTMILIAMAARRIPLG